VKQVTGVSAVGQGWIAPEAASRAAQQIKVQVGEAATTTSDFPH